SARSLEGAGHAGTRHRTALDRDHRPLLLHVCRRDRWRYRPRPADRLPRRLRPPGSPPRRRAVSRQTLLETPAYLAKVGARAAISPAWTPSAAARPEGA